MAIAPDLGCLRPVLPAYARCCTVLLGVGGLCPVLYGATGTQASVLWVRGSRICTPADTVGRVSLHTRTHGGQGRCTPLKTQGGQGVGGGLLLTARAAHGCVCAGQG
eukprot:CAMPEP_0181317324 /NCGR_PEP_ID=MMETSP1101-20121128/16408_1 /TAXON_ID=46948 /ORGANISM="Rhodomonas abbreviata, Strain Caron Lab Isolate" /LENGTH=106 /DNA_ID=CAMNT_0023424711 /DNA_START=238 /DNA_END=554 /DNA_ORIENTATION=-